MSGHLQLIPKLRTCGVSLHSTYTRTSSRSGATEQKKNRRYPPPILYHLHHHHLQGFVVTSLLKNSTQYFIFHFWVYILHSGLSKCNGKMFQKICLHPLCSVLIFNCFVWDSERSYCLIADCINSLLFCTAQQLLGTLFQLS